MFSVPLSRHPVANSAALFIPSCTTSRFSPSFTNLAPRPNPKFAACSSILQEKNHEASSAADDALKGKGGRLESVKGTSLPLFAPMKTAKRVVLVRHGQSTWNAEGRIQGSSDFSVLTPKGESQAETSRLMLIDDVFDVCFSSPLKRSKRTADVIWGNREEAMITDYDLREIDLYSFQGLLKREGKEKFGAAFHQWKVDAPNFVIDEHYPVRELWERAKNCWISILAHESKSVLVVAHNAVNQALIATALGLGTEYFRILLQSNCGVSVLDFTPKPEGGSPLICLNRLNQTPSSPIAGGSSAGREGGQRIILVCHGALDKNEEASSLELEDPPMNMLGVIQSQKTAELLLDLNVSKVVSSPKRASKDTAETISRVQEAADCLGADCVPRYVEMKQIEELDAVNIYQQAEKPEGINSQAVESLWAETGKAWRYLLDEYSGDPDSAADGENIVVVAHPMVHVALMTHCLNLTVDWVGYFHVDEGSISVIDFPDGPEGRGVVRCINYTAHLGRWAIPITKM